MFVSKTALKIFIEVAKQRLREKKKKRIITGIKSIIVLKKGGL